MTRVSGSGGCGFASLLPVLAVGSGQEGPIMTMGTAQGCWEHGGGAQAGAVMKDKWELEEMREGVKQVG